jgi:hypothetical protein
MPLLRRYRKFRNPRTCSFSTSTAFFIPLVGFSVRIMSPQLRCRRGMPATRRAFSLNGPDSRLSD